MELDRLLSEILTAAYNEAKHSGHEYFTPEHILYAALIFDEGREFIENLGGNPERLKEALSDYLKENIEKVPDAEPLQTVMFQRILSAAASHVIACGKSIVTLEDIIVAIYDEEESFAGFFLKSEGIKRLDLLNYVTSGKNKDDAEESFIENGYDEDEEEMSEGNKKGILEKYTLDLTEKAKRGELDPLIGREDIIERTLQVLSRRHKNNPIHVGDAGVGKTAITEGLARLIAEEKVPPHLKNCKIYSLDMGAILAGTKYRGDFEERIKKILHEIKCQENAIVYIDEIHTVIGAGSVSGGFMDASNILKPFLDRGGLRVIGSTTYDEYKKVFEKDRALARRFQKIEVPEASIEDTFTILKGLKDYYEKYHNVTYTDEALRSAAELSAKYIQDRHLPDKAVDVVDEAGARARLHAAEEESAALVITEKEIEKIVSFIGKVPEQSVTADEVEKLKNLENELKGQIFGQNPAIETIVRAIKRSRAGFNEGDKPIASFLFVGPTGVGKTEISKQLAQCLGIPLVRFDMSEYQEKHTVARLIGAPPGYVGYEEGGLLTDAVRKTPYCVLLLDEIEKVHQDVLNILLQVMDYATLTDNNGKKADFKNVILIMTSNAGARELGKSIIGFGERLVLTDAIASEVEKFFSPEFRNRLDEIVVFNKLSMEMAVLVAKKALRQFEEKLIARKIKLKVSNVCIEWIAEKGCSSNYGAREIFRIVQQKIKPYFVDEVLFGELSKGGTALVDFIEGQIKITKDN